MRALAQGTTPLVSRGRDPPLTPHPRFGILKDCHPKWFVLASFRFAISVEINSYEPFLIEVQTGSDPSRTRSSTSIQKKKKKFFNLKRIRLVPHDG